LAILNITFDTERKEKDYSVLLKDNELKASLLKSKNTFIGLIALVLCFTVLLCLYLYNRFYFRKKAHLKLKSLNQQLSDRNQEFETVNKELEEVSKEKDKLFSIIAHELRNPLFWLQNLTETLSRKHQAMPPEKIHKTLLSLDESARNVYHLMDNLLHWSRSRLNRIHPVKADHDLATIVSDTFGMYESFFGQKEIVFLNSVPQGIMIHADADLLSCVIRNLISNAIKYTPRGGRISIHHHLTQGNVNITISDSGKGFSPPESVTTNINDSVISMPGLMQEKGSGLGLILCRDFVEMNGGQIQVKSRPGIGTKVSFTVPLSAAYSFMAPEREMQDLLY
jgi:signal transduction histidine kinase